MRIEYEEFGSIEDVFLYMSAAAPPMKNTLPVNSYRGYVMSFIPTSSHSGDSYLMIYAKGSLEKGIYEFDLETRAYKAVPTVERADKHYFVSLTPTKNTIADAALEKL